MDIEKAIKDLDRRVSKLEGKSEPAKSPKAAKKAEFVGATGGIRYLISKGFFRQKRTFAEIRQALTDEGYHYTKQAVQNPLTAMSKVGGALVSLKEGKRKVYATRK
jgi:hypothetical protein